MRFTLLTDGEPSIVAFAEAVKLRMAGLSGMEAGSISIQQAPRDSHQSNGGVERSVQTIRALARTYVSALSRKIGADVAPNHACWAWCIRHAACIYNRYHRKAALNMLTPYEKCKGKQFQQPILGVGEAIWARRLGAALNKALNPLVSGLWLGRDAASNEHIVATWGGRL